MQPEVGRRQQVLGVLRGSKKARTVSELAKMIRVHGNTVRFHLESLLADGLIEVEEQALEKRSVGRPAVRYPAIARVAPSQIRHTETLVKLFLGDLAADPEGAARAEEIGKRWGRTRAEEIDARVRPGAPEGDLKALSSLLEDMGFESDPPANSQMLVKTCPFIGDMQPGEVAKNAAGGEEEDTLPPVCAVHLGVMKGALEEWGADTQVAELTPFAQADRCRISLARGR